MWLFAYAFSLLATNTCPCTQAFSSASASASASAFATHKFDESRHLPARSAPARVLVPVQQAPHKHNTHSQCSSSLRALPPTLPWVVAHVVAGASGAPIVATATRREDGWYRQIPLPSFTPPDFVFAPVWTLLYALMGVAVGRIYRISRASSTRISTVALGTWAVHMLLNLSWAPIFFGVQRLLLGLMINIAMWVTLVGIILPSFYFLNPVSAYLLLPYLLWLSFAVALNWSICRLNPTMEGYNNAKFQAQLTQLQRRAAEYSGL